MDIWRYVQSAYRDTNRDKDMYICIYRETCGSMQMEICMHVGYI